MLRKKENTLWIILGIMALLLTGCSGEAEVSDVETVKEILCGIHDEAQETHDVGSVDTMERMVARLDAHGYAAVDSANQVDMTNAKQAVGFCEAVNQKADANLTIIVVMEQGFRKFDFKTEDGVVDIVRAYYQYDENGNLQERSTVNYLSDFWQFTEEGYLIFEGSYFSDLDYALTLSDTPEHTALRVLPLDETCRELNRKYVLPAGYSENNVFLCDWSGEDYGELDFYDIFDCFYPIFYGEPIPYTADEDLSVEAVFQVPENIFENVILSYFPVDLKTLHQKTKYISEKKAYEYRPRGFQEVEYPDIPYPEVVDYTENQDGTVTLSINAVYPHGNTSKAFSHTTVVRPLAEGGFQYVSNEMNLQEKDYNFWWHSNRLTEEERTGNDNAGMGGGERTGNDNADTGGKDGEAESDLWVLPQAENCLFTEAEKEELNSMALAAAREAKTVYQEAEVAEETPDSSHIKALTKEQCREAVSLLGNAGYVSVAEDTNMDNYEKIEDFYAAYSEKRDAMVTVFNVNRDGLLDVVTFIYRDGELQTYYVGIHWREGGIPETGDTFVSDIAEIKLTEKGYFIYAYETIIPHSSLRQCFRVKPLSDKCRELTAKYIYGLSYVNYNVLVKNWDRNNVEDILMPCMFEDIYRIYTGENLQAPDGRIPAETYEKIMTTYFPVSTEVLRDKCGYDESSNSYKYEMIYATPYPPVGEVVDYTENSDGTLTLTVDGVWADYNSDCAFTNTIVVQPFDDGTFRYLSNFIERKELELPRAAESKNTSEQITKEKLLEQIEKGYNLPVDAHQRKAAEEDCKRMITCIRDINIQADKGNYEKINAPVITTGVYADMENYESVDKFLKKCMEGLIASIVVYQIHSGESIGRLKFIFDGTDMYVLSAVAAWEEENEPRISYISCTRIKEWEYTDKGWFCYELCVPEYPEVTEVVNGNCMLRVKPMTDENREMSEKCVLGLSYQGNNLLCSNWDKEHVEELDYNGLYSYLYAMKYGKNCEPENYHDGIPKEEFEKLMMEYLPVTEEDIQKYAAFDAESQTYVWERLGCSNYAPTYFGTSVPEVTQIKANADGTVTLTVDAVCQMLCDDAVITHELTVRLHEDGSFRYLGNRILDEIRDSNQTRLPS